MDSSEPRASGGERRLSTRTSTSLSNDSHGSRSDESYDLSEWAVADGFRPTQPSHVSTTTPQSSRQPPSSSHTRTHSTSPSPPSESSSRPQETPQSPPTATSANFTSKTEAASTHARPSSISKAHRPHESLALRNDGSSPGAENRSTRPQLPALATDSHVPRNDSGVGAVSGPTHPYHAYPQRTMSTTTSSTGAPIREGEYTGPRGPTHPYSLYPQTTAPVEDSNGQQIPVGFSGIGATYQRQIGPDGEEEGDLIGPLGHMEELPPYTRYPEEAYMRNSPGGMPDASPATTSTPTNAVAPPQAPYIPGAGGIGIATRNPEYSSTEENLVAARSSRSGNSSETGRSDINTAARDFSEKLPTGKWQRRARKKLWGVIPYWAIGLLVVGLIILGVVMGAVLGILMADDNSHGHGEDESPATFQPSPTADVELLSALPPNFPPLATGDFELPPLDASQAPRSCFNDTTQAQSWSCEMPFRYYTMSVGMVEHASQVQNYEITLEAVNGSNAIYVWGTQPPSLKDPEPLRLVNDTFEPARGPAWWREIVYDKAVIVSDSSFSMKTKRDWTYNGPPKSAFNPSRFMSSNPGPVDGEKAWICTWPNVTMEVFIYPSQNTSLPNPSISTKAPPATTTGVLEMTTGVPEVTTGVPEMTTGVPEMTTGAPTTTGVPEVGETQTANDPKPPYPQVVKFLERRLFEDNDETAAVCRQVKVVNHGRDSVPVLDDDGNPIEVEVIERRSTYDELMEQQERSRHPARRWEDEDTPLLRRESLELTDCGCLWWST